MARRSARAALPASGLPGALRCRRKFLRQFPGGFQDPTYLDWERDYKWETHLRWKEALPRAVFDKLLQDGEFAGLVREDLADLRPRDMIDLQSFLWVQGSDEY